MLRMRVWRAFSAQMFLKLEFGGLFAWGIPNPLYIIGAKGFKGPLVLQNWRCMCSECESGGPFWRRSAWDSSLEVVSLTTFAAVDASCFTNWP